jgi:hypothetical protein
MSETGGNDIQGPNLLPEKPAEVGIAVRDGKVYLGHERGWCGPAEFMEHVGLIYENAGGGKPKDGLPIPKIFSRLSLMMAFGMTKREWTALSKLPEWQRACEVVDVMAEAWMETKLAESSGRNPAGIIFAMKNTHDWRDQPETAVDDALAKMLNSVLRLPEKRPPPLAELGEGG